MKTGIKNALQELTRHWPTEGYPGLVDYLTRQNERHWRVYKFSNPGSRAYALVAEGVHAGCAAECMLWRPYAEEWTKKAEVVIGSGRYTINGKVYTERDDLGVVVPEGCIESVPAGAEGGY
jgi:hypothetical protein